MRERGSTINLIVFWNTPLGTSHSYTWHKHPALFFFFLIIVELKHTLGENSDMKWDDVAGWNLVNTNHCWNNGATVKLARCFINMLLQYSHVVMTPSVCEEELVSILLLCEQQWNSTSTAREIQINTNTKVEMMNTEISKSIYIHYSSFTSASHESLFTNDIRTSPRCEVLLWSTDLGTN